MQSWQRDLQTIFHAGTLAGLSDGQLLERIADHRGAGSEEGLEVESAFALLIERHGPMVLRVCRSVLGDPHEAEDAFQATFLVLLRQAGSIHKRESVGPWLHGVARRVAACARSAAARRRVHERRWFERRRDAMPSANLHDVDLTQTIHTELDRLPERYRAPIVLCDLEERSLDEAARQLGWPLGTVKSRLNRGRERLRDRLVCRGVTPGVAGLVLSGSAAIREAGAAMALSPALTQATAHLFGETGAVAVSSSASVLAVAKAMQRIILMSQMRMAAGALIVVGVTAVGIGALASGPRQAAPDDVPAKALAAKAVTQAEKTARKNDQKAAPTPKPRARREDGSHIETIDISGRATDPSGRPVAGAKVQAGLCDDPRRPAGGKSWSWTHLDATNAAPGDRRDFHGFYAMPEDLFTTRTGPDGTYQIDGLPREARLLTLIDPGPEYDANSEAIATTTKAVPDTRNLGYDAVLDRTFTAPREIEFFVKYGDTNQPARNATLRVKDPLGASPCGLDPSHPTPRRKLQGWLGSSRLRRRSPQEGRCERHRALLHTERRIAVLRGLIEVVAGLGLGHAVVDDVGLVETVERGRGIGVAVTVDVNLGLAIDLNHAVDSGLGELLLGELGEAADGVAVVELDQPDALGIAADGADGSPIAVRMTRPPLVVSMISSASVTLATATTGPLRSEVWMSMRPLPPRFCVRYSVSRVRLP